jgi:hypothetical protein
MSVTVTTHSYRNRSQSKTIFDLAQTVETLVLYFVTYDNSFMTTIVPITFTAMMQEMSFQISRFAQPLLTIISSQIFNFGK